MDYMYFDVIIIGGGIAGLMSAYCTDLPQNRSMLIIEPGAGASRGITGLNLPLSEQDSIGCFYQDTLESGKHQNDSVLAKALCEECFSILPVLKKIGFQFDETEGSVHLRKALGSTFPRVCGRGNYTGTTVMRLLHERLSVRQNVVIRKDLRALHLFTEQCSMKGVLAYCGDSKQYVYIQTKAVVLATGGFCGIYPFSTNSSDIAGDGIAMAYNAGARLTDMEFVQFDPCATVWPPFIRGEGMITTVLYEGAVIRNALGDRFMQKYSDFEERVNKDYLSYCIAREVKEGRGSEHGGVYFDCSAVGRERLIQAYDICVNRYARAGIDIAETCVEVGPAPHTSLGGVVIDGQCATDIAGLFACGEVTGGIHGANRIGGNAALEVLLFGMKAGRSLAAYLEKAPDEERERSLDTLILAAASSNEIYTVRKRMEELLSSAAGVIRCETELKNAEMECKEMRLRLDDASMYNDTELTYETYRLKNDLLCAQLLFGSALRRRGSIGVHIRSDSEGEGVPYRIIIRRGADEPEFHKEPLS